MKLLSLFSLLFLLVSNQLVVGSPYKFIQHDGFFSPLEKQLLVDIWQRNTGQLLSRIYAGEFDIPNSLITSLMCDLDDIKAHENRFNKKYLLGHATPQDLSVFRVRHCQEALFIATFCAIGVPLLNIRDTIKRQLILELQQFKLVVEQRLATECTRLIS